MESRRYVLFNPGCKGCPTNTTAHAEWKWFEDAPHARGHAVRGEFGTQVVRCWQIFESTAHVNTFWHAMLRGTVWSNYRLVSTQWRGSPGSALFPNGEVPRFLTNVTLETYDSIHSRRNVHGLPREGGDLGRTGRQLQLLPEQGEVARARRQP